MFPRANGRIRLYLLHDVAQRGRFAGPDRAQAFLAAYRGLTCIPGSDELFAAARPAGPCAFYPMNDTWTDEPFAPGRRAGRRRGRLERPDHRAGPVHRAA